MEPVRIPSDLCVCGHWIEDHGSKFIVGEGDDERECGCSAFTPAEENDDWGYWFTDDEGRKIEGRA